MNHVNCFDPVAHGICYYSEVDYFFEGLGLTAAWLCIVVSLVFVIRAIYLVFENNRLLKEKT